MSNVLIGIIGVVLFIGLALAGALILGSDFQNATSSSKAARVVQTLQQVAAAANMYQMKTGVTLYETDNALLVPRFLKIYPDNPIVGPSGDRRLQVKLSNGVDDNQLATPGAQANFASARMYYENSTNVEVCRAIQEQAVGTPTSVPPPLSAAILAQPFGCGYYGVTLYAFARI